MWKTTKYRVLAMLSAGMFALLALTACGADGGSQEGIGGETKATAESKTGSDSGAENSSDDGHNHKIKVSFDSETVTFKSSGTPVKVPFKAVAAEGTKLESPEVKVEGLPEYVKWDVTEPKVSPDGTEATGEVSFTLTSNTAPRGDHATVVSVKSGDVIGHGSLKVQVTATSCA